MKVIMSKSFEALRYIRILLAALLDAFMYKVVPDANKMPYVLIADKELSFFLVCNCGRLYLIVNIFITKRKCHETN